jgi:hypothetical protein
MALAMGFGEVGFSEAYIWLIRLASTVARPVLPLPGIPLIATMKRASSAVKQNLAGELLALVFAYVYGDFS